MTTSRIMWTVCGALLPGLIAMLITFGVGVLWNLVWLTTLCLVVEGVCRRLADAEYRFGVKSSTLDGSTWVTAWLMAICLPPGTAIGVLAIASLAAIGMAKHAYGGLGRNVFNPAMVGYAVVLISFPELLANWPAPSHTTDGLTGATVLSEFKYRAGVTVAEFELSHGQTVNAQANVAVAFALGGIVLWYLKLIAWRVPAGVFLGLALGVLLGYDQGSSTSLGSLFFHLSAGGLVAGAFFVATDPVTHPQSHRGQILFGVLVGLLTYLIRGLGSFPDGFAFAILSANCTTPLLNRWHRQQLAEQRRTSSQAGPS